MDEDIEIINTQTRNEKIKNFFINNKNSLISILVIIILNVKSLALKCDIDSPRKMRLRGQGPACPLKTS